MKRITFAALAAALLGAGTILKAQELPKIPPPLKGHEWLNQFVGDWEHETEIFMDPGKPPVKAKGSESVRSLGGFWIVADGKSEMMGTPFTSVLTLGYDPQAKKYIGTWVDSMSSTLWKYEGSVDSTGKVLTLETEGPCPMKPGQIVKFHEVTEFKSKDERVFTSKMLGDDGKWNTIVRVTSKRVK
jgi:Protein of unknown function (DUF1579)